MKYTNIGVQIFPAILLVVGFGYWAMQERAMGGFCIVLAILMWLVILGESFNKE